MSETEKTVDQPFLVKMVAWIAAIAFFALLMFIVYFSATYEPPQEAFLIYQILFS